MRVFLIMLIFAIGFSGFSAVAHAFDSQTCDQMMSVENAPLDKMADKMDCAEHVKKTDSQEKSSKEGKHLCLSCGHCCVSHVAITQHNIQFNAHIIKTAYPHTDISLDDNVISGLKRPPKSLV